MKLNVIEIAACIGENNFKTREDMIRELRKRRYKKVFNFKTFGERVNKLEYKCKKFNDEITISGLVSKQKGKTIYYTKKRLTKTNEKLYNHEKITMIALMWLFDADKIVYTQELDFNEKCKYHPEDWEEIKTYTQKYKYHPEDWEQIRGYLEEFMKEM